MLYFATDSVRAFNPYNLGGDANGGLLDELAFANLGYKTLDVDIAKRSGWVHVTELPAREVSVVESDDEPEQNIGNAESHFTDRYAAMAENLGLSESEWKTLEDQLDEDRYDDQENYYSRPWESEARHDEIVEAFDAELCRARRKALKAKNGYKTHEPSVWRDLMFIWIEDDHIIDRARRGKGDGRRSRRPVPTHHAFGLVMHDWFSPLDEDYDFVPLIDPDEIREKIDAEAEFHEYESELLLYLTDFDRWFETCTTDRGQVMLMWMRDAWYENDHRWYTQFREEIEYLRWTRNANLAHNPDATIVFDDWLHKHAECGFGCLVCKHEEEEARWREQEELSFQQFDAHVSGDCHPEHCEFCAEEHAHNERAYLWDQHERGLCSLYCEFCAYEYAQWELEAEAYERHIEAERMRVIDEYERMLDDLQDRFDAARRRERRKVLKAKGGCKRSERAFSSNEIISYIEDYYAGKARRGLERSYRGKQWQRHKPRHKPTVPAWVHFEPVIYEDDILVAA